MRRKHDDNPDRSRTHRQYLVRAEVRQRLNRGDKTIKRFERTGVLQRITVAMMQDMGLLLLCDRNSNVIFYGDKDVERAKRLLDEG
jgi:hypothetical protein